MHHRPAARDQQSFADLRREEFPWAPAHLWLDAASIGPLPRRALMAVETFTRARAAPHQLQGVDLLGILARSRALVARLVGATPEEIALTTNTSYGLNLVARMLPLGPGDIVIVPDREFPANVYPWLMLDDRGVRLERVPLTAEGWPDEEALLARVAEPRVRVLAVSLVQFHSGYRVDLARLGRRCRETDTVLVVDAIQGIGVVPCDLRQGDVDFLACGAQKWLLSPWGTGFLYVQRRWIEQLRPPFAGWTAFHGTDDFSDLCRYDTHWRSDARRFELVTLPFQDLVGMNASLELVLELGVDRIGRHVRATHEPVLAWADWRGVRVASPRDQRGSGILALALDDPRGAWEALQRAGIRCSVREGLLRFSPHCYTSVADMERVAEVLDTVAGQAGTRGRRSG